MAKSNQITHGRLQILMYLVNRTGWVLPTEVLDNVKPDGITTLHGVRKALNELECVEMKNITPAGRPNYQCRMKTDPKTFHTLVTKAFDHNRKSQTVFMRSQYYQGMPSELVHQFEDSILDNDQWLFARPSDDDNDDMLVVLDYDERTEPLEIEWEYGLTDEDKSSMTNALRFNWLALKWVVHFISAKGDERSMILQQLMETAHNPAISPTAARATGKKKGFCQGMDKCGMWIRDNAQPAYRKARLEAEMNNTSSNHINWRELFNQLDNLNSNYRYLFD